MFEELTFDGDNSYPDCKQCGTCCEITVLAMLPEELDKMHSYITENNIKPNTEDKGKCCFVQADGRCGIWEARPQVCKLFNCHVPRFEVLRQNPNITVPENLILVDLHKEFSAENH